MLRMGPRFRSVEVRTSRAAGRASKQLNYTDWEGAHAKLIVCKLSGDTDRNDAPAPCSWLTRTKLLLNAIHALGAGVTAPAAINYCKYTGNQRPLPTM
ncbi:hypothetical protein EVAR_96061_1 [Eumeta japonica]|uniref:Uncharacterized protein n=1 Tax=Eumeta variegata TaxID=151549 RepID=A0A4C1W6V6_EUMVA|nr:hypothetical protein EVAR_96061_1 [Eumeta japonica]